MFSRSFRTLAYLAPLGLTASTAWAGAGNNDPNGNNNGPRLVAYGCAHETQELFRYDFEADTYTVVGVVRDQFNQVCVEMGSMAFIPTGPDAGMYGAPTGGAAKGCLVRIDPLTAKATRPSSKILASAPQVWGMTAFKEAGKWKILATDGGKNLIVINPATGIGEVKCVLANKYGGLAMNWAGRTGIESGTPVVYAVAGKKLYSFPFPASTSGTFTAPTQTQIGTPHSFATTEALEFAFSDTEARVVIPTLPESWLADGALLGFCENDALVAFNPATGKAQEYICTMPVKDFESMVFLTKLQDGVEPIFNAHD